MPSERSAARLGVTLGTRLRRQYRKDLAAFIDLPPVCRRPTDPSFPLAPA
jgi:hypothetical protein